MLISDAHEQLSQTPERIKIICARTMKDITKRVCWPHYPPPACLKAGAVVLIHERTLLLQHIASLAVESGP